MMFKLGTKMYYKKRNLGATTVNQHLQFFPDSEAQNISLAAACDKHTAKHGDRTLKWISREAYTSAADAGS